MSKSKRATHKRTRRHDRQQISERVVALRQVMDSQLADIISSQCLGDLGIESITSLGQVRIRR